MIFKKKTSGFSLIELLVVIGILSLLATVVFARVSQTRGKTRDTVRVEDLKTLDQAVQSFIVENGKLPANTTEIVTFFNINLKDPLASSRRSYLYGVTTNPDGTKYYCLGARMEVRSMSPRPCEISQGYTANYTIKGP